MKMFVLFVILCVLPCFCREAGAKYPGDERRESATATIEMNVVASAGDSISPYIYGGFVEFIGNTINHKYGLWAQEIDYRGFEGDDGNGDGIADEWFPLNSGDNSCTFSQDTVRYNKGGNYSQHIEVGSYRRGKIGVGQSSVHIRPGVMYDVYLYLKGVVPEHGVTVWLLDDTLTWNVYDSLTFDGVHGEWAKYAGILVPMASSEYGMFAITIQEEGSLWIDDVSLMAQDAVDGVRSSYIELIEEMRPTIMRYPGGCFADGDGNHWLNGVGDVDQRPPNWDNYWEMFQRLDFGPDEYMKCCSNASMEPQITVNFGSGTPAEAGDWVEYMNGDPQTPCGALRANNGHPQPYHVRYWEVGNEQYGEWEIGHTSAFAYASQFIDFANEMKVRDPDINVIANGCLYKQDWNNTVLSVAGDVMDYISIHICCPNISEDVTNTYTDEEIYLAVVAAPLKYEDTIAQIEAAIEALTTNNVRIAVTELFMCYSRNPLYTKHGETMETALYIAGMLNLFQRRSDIVDIANWTTVGDIKWSLASAGFYRTTGFHVLSLYANHNGPIPVSCIVDCPLYASPHVGSIAIRDSVPYLDVSVTRDEDAMYINVVNRSLEDIEATINITGGKVAPEAIIRTVSGPDYLSSNHNPPHDNVMLEEATLSGVSDTFVYTFPAHSVTGIEMSLDIEQIKGDVNGDGSVDILDVVMTVNIILGLHVPTPEQTWAADCLDDGEINILDVLCIINIILGFQGK